MLNLTEYKILFSFNFFFFLRTKNKRSNLCYSTLTHSEYFITGHRVLGRITLLRQLNCGTSCGDTVAHTEATPHTGNTSVHVLSSQSMSSQSMSCPQSMSLQSCPLSPCPLSPAAETLRTHCRHVTVTASVPLDTLTLGRLKEEDVTAVKPKDQT